MATEEAEQIDHSFHLAGQKILPLTPERVWQAGLAVETYFPPQTKEHVFQVLTALNLLNAAVKMEMGAEVVCYHYIKGMAACLFVHLLLHPIEDVDLYMDKVNNVCYFRIYGWQVSFHYVAFTPAMRRLIKRCEMKPQEWDGLRLQDIAVNLFLHANPQAEEYSDESLRMVAPRLLQRPIHQPLYYYHDSTKTAKEMTGRPYDHAKPVKACDSGAVTEAPVKDFVPEFRPRNRETLFMALTFNAWRNNEFMLYRRRDNLTLRMIRYTGNNYTEFRRFFKKNYKKVKVRKKRTFAKGKLYHVTPQNEIHAVSPAVYAKLLVHYQYVLQEGGFCSLAMPYGIALYLADRYPDLRFINLLNYHYHEGPILRYLYSKHRMLALTPHAPARRLKVWIPYDCHHLLFDLEPDDIPEELVQEYAATEDYYREYEIIWHGNLCGILAYRQRMILPVRYQQIIVRHYTAHVQNTEGLWAFFSLEGEHFVTPFSPLDKG